MCNAATRLVVLAFLVVGVQRAAAGERPGMPWFRFAVYGGSDGRREAHRKMVAQMVRFRPELVLHTGAMVRDGRRPEHWREYAEATAPLRAICRIYPCRTRHDGARLAGGRFRFPDGTTQPSTFYAFDYKGARFIALDSEVAPRPNDEQSTWLKAQLLAAQGKLIVVFFHRPFLSVARKRLLGGGLFHWHPLFAKHRVRAVFTGAHHLYYRTAHDGVTYIVTGGGGGPLDPVMVRRRLMPTDVAGSFHHAIELEVLRNAVRGCVRDIEGRVRDRFTLALPHPSRPAGP